MYLVTKRGLIQITADPEDPKSEKLLVSARQEAFFHDFMREEGYFTDHTFDYPYRAWVDREVAVDLIGREIAMVDYPRFGDAIPDAIFRSIVAKVYSQFKVLGSGRLFRKIDVSEFENLSGKDLPEHVGKGLKNGRSQV